MVISPKIIAQIKERREKMRGRKPLKKTRRPDLWLFPNTALRKYEKQLQAYIDEYRDLVHKNLIDKLDILHKEVHALRPDSIDYRGDDWVSRLAAFLKTILDRLEKNTPNPESYVPQIAKEAADYNKSQFHKVIASVIGVEVLIAEPWLASEINNFVRKNVGYIKSIPTENLQQIEMIVTQGLRSGISTAEMKKQIIPLIDEKIDQASRRASLIARDQLGSLNGQLTQLRQKELGVERYIWITSQDERVRSLHQARNNKIYSWNDPPSDGHPGEPVRCRCIASPQLDDLINNIS